MNSIHSVGTNVLEKPAVATAELTRENRFLRQRSAVDETTLVRSFRQWVRDQIARGWQNS